MITASEAISFWEKCEPEPNTGCWIWTASTVGHMGYGQFGVRRTSTYPRKNWLAHRLAWTMERGPIPDGLLVMHRCDNPLCVNVAHLVLGTAADNMADMIAKGRARHYSKPHTAEARAKISAAQKGRRKSAATRARMSAAQRARHQREVANAQP